MFYKRRVNLHWTHLHVWFMYWKVPNEANDREVHVLNSQSYKVNKNSWLQATPFTTNSYHNSFIYILIPSHNSVHFLIPSHNSIHLLIPSYNSDNFHIPSPYLVHYLSIFPNMLPNFPAAPCWNCLIIPCKPCIPPTTDTQTSQHTYRSRSYCKYFNLNILHLYQYTSRSLVSIVYSSKCKCIYICLYI